MVYSEETGARFRRQRAEMAVNLAVQSKWDDAVTVNQSVLSVYPNDVDACNRLGKALTELGRYEEARDAYGKALGIEPSNTIAKKNLTRLADMKSLPKTAETVTARVDPRLFIEEAGKTAVMALQPTSVPGVLAKVTAGDQVQLNSDGQHLTVLSLTSDVLGTVEPRMGARLVQLIADGNRYEAAITSLNESQVRIIVRETYQSAAMAGRPSFPSKTDAGFRPYIKDSIVKYGLDDDEDSDDDGDSSDWPDEERMEEAVFFTQPLSGEPAEEDDDADD